MYISIAWYREGAGFSLICAIYMQTAVVVQWDVYVQCSRHTYSGHMLIMYSSAPGHIVACSDFT